MEFDQSAFLAMKRDIMPVMPPKSNRAKTIRNCERRDCESNCAERMFSYLKINRSIAAATNSPIAFSACSSWFQLVTGSNLSCGLVKFYPFAIEKAATIMRFRIKEEGTKLYA